MICPIDNQQCGWRCQTPCTVPTSREAFHDMRRIDFEREVYARCDREDAELLAQSPALPGGEN